MGRNKELIMADKEERILCLKVDDKDFVYLPNAKNYKVPEDIYKVIIGGSMTKQEAIEVMAKAIFEDMLKGHNLTWEDADISAKNLL
jgi:hypothetical protein